MGLWKITRFDFGNQLNRRTFILVLFFLVFCIVIVQLGIGDYKGLKSSCETFSRMETLKAEKSINLISKGFTGGYSFRFKPVPSPLFALAYSASNFGDMFSYFGNDETLEVSKHHDIKEMFRQSIFNFGLLSFLLMVLSVAAIVWGFFSFRNKKFTRFQLRFAKLRVLFAGVTLSRMLFVICVLFLFLVVVFFQYLINGLSLTVHEVFLLSAVFGVLALVFGFMFAAGVLFGIRCKKGKLFNSALGALLFWVAFMVILPGIFNRVFPDIEAQRVTSMYKTEFEKYTIVNDFENFMHKEIGKHDDLQSKRRVYGELLGMYFKDYRKKINDLNENKVNSIKKGFHKVSLYNALFPVTFYGSFCREVSSMGYNAFIGIYVKTIKAQGNLMRGYHVVRPNVDYLKGENFIFEQKSGFSSSLLLGLIMSLLYWVVLGLAAYRRLKTSIFPKGDAEKIKAFREKCKAGISVEKEENGGFEGIVNTFFAGGIIEEGTENKGNGLYLFDAAEMPGDVNIKGLAKLAGLKNVSEFENKSFCDVKEERKESLVLSILGSLKINVLFMDDIKSIRFYKRVKEIVKEAVVYERLSFNAAYLLKRKG